MRRPPLHVAGQVTPFGLQSVRLLPNGLFDDPQLRCINALPLFTRVRARQSFARIRILPCGPHLRGADCAFMLDGPINADCFFAYVE